MENGLHLIVGRVTDCHVSSAEFFGCLAQEFVAGGSGGCFPAVSANGRFTRGVGPADFHRDA
jgi:hypothetical protein